MACGRRAELEVGPGMCSLPWSSCSDNRRQELDDDDDDEHIGDDDPSATGGDRGVPAVPPGMPATMQTNTTANTAASMPAGVATLRRQLAVSRTQRIDAINRSELGLLTNLPLYAMSSYG